MRDTSGCMRDTARDTARDIARDGQAQPLSIRGNCAAFSFLHQPHSFCPDGCSCDADAGADEASGREPAARQPASSPREHVPLPTECTSNAVSLQSDRLADFGNLCREAVDSLRACLSSTQSSEPLPTPPGCVSEAPINTDPPVQQISEPIELAQTYFGKWQSPEIGRFAGRVVHTAAFSSDELSSLHLTPKDAAVDSGATSSLTPDESSLINRRPCKELFRSATGELTRCTSIGDMPVILLAGDGKKYRLVFRNVRCVPGFKYTLLSVTQMWAEQRIDARFRDISALTLEHEGSEIRLPYLKDKALPTLRAASTALAPPDSKILSSFEALDSASGAAGVQTGHVNLAVSAGTPTAGSEAPTTEHSALAALGFHHVGSSAHIARLPAAQAAELFHRRCHAGIDKIRAIAHTTKDAPKVLASASSVCTCVACAAARAPRVARQHA